MRYFITAQEGMGLLEKGPVFIADCRGDLNDASWGFKVFKEGHIPGAQFIDGEILLSGPVRKRGGRHPLPDLARFGYSMELLGLSDAMPVLAYGIYAARLIMLLELIGRPLAWILDGGIEAWTAAGGTLTPHITHPDKGSLEVRPDRSMLVSREELLYRIRLTDAVLLDARSPERYRGEVEPLDPVAGRIPGALNWFWEKSFDTAKKLRSPELLKKELPPEVLSGKRIINYCGSGVTACFNLLLLRELGLNPQIYAEGWSDWVSYPKAPVEINGSKK